MLVPSVVATVIWIGCSTPCRGRGLDEPDRPLDGAGRVVLEPEREREVEEHLGIRRPLDLRVQRRVDREGQVALDRGELADQPVVHPEPVLVAERVAVRLLDRAAVDARMCANTSGVDVARELPAGSGRSTRAPRCGRRLVSPTPYQPRPNPSPFVVSRPAVECRLWSISECAGLSRILERTGDPNTRAIGT